MVPEYYCYIKHNIKNDLKACILIMHVCHFSARYSMSMLIPKTFHTCLYC